MGRGTHAERTADVVRAAEVRPVADGAFLVLEHPDRRAERAAARAEKEAGEWTHDPSTHSKGKADVDRWTDTSGVGTRVTHTASERYASRRQGAVVGPASTYDVENAVRGAVRGDPVGEFHEYVADELDAGAPRFADVPTGTRVGLLPGDDPVAVVDSPDTTVLVGLGRSGTDAEAFADRLGDVGFGFADLDAVVAPDLDYGEAVLRAAAAEGARSLFPARERAHDEMLGVLDGAPDDPLPELLVHGERERATLGPDLTVESLAFAPGDEAGSRHVPAVVDERRDVALVAAGRATFDDDVADVDGRLDAAADAFDRLADDRLGDEADVVLQVPADIDPEALDRLADGVGATAVWLDGPPEEPDRGPADRARDRLPGLSAPRSPLDALDDAVAVRVADGLEAPAIDAMRVGTERTTVGGGEGFDRPAPERGVGWPAMLDAVDPSSATVQPVAVTRPRARDGEGSGGESTGSRTPPDAASGSERGQ